MTADIDAIGLFWHSNPSAIHLQLGCKTRVADDDILAMTSEIRQHRRRDELVVAVLQAELSKGCATGRAVSLAVKLLELYEGVPT